MPYQNIEELPNDVKEQLPQGAQQIFCAAYNSASRDGLNDNQAHQVAWNSVKNSYEQVEHGQWQHKSLLPHQRVQWKGEVVPQYLLSRWGLETAEAWVLEF